MDLVRAIRDGVLRRQGDHDRVVDRVEVAFGGEAKRRVVRTGHADGRRRVGAVAHAVTVGVRVRRVRAVVHLIGVQRTVRVVVEIFDQSG